MPCLITTLTRSFIEKTKRKKNKQQKKQKQKFERQTAIVQNHNCTNLFSSYYTADGNFFNEAR